MSDRRYAITRPWWRRKPVACYRAPGLFWFRVFGKGWHFRDTSRHPLRFSERTATSGMWTVRRLR